MNEARSVRLALLAILLLAAWLRLDGIGFGLDLSSPERALFTNDVDARGMVQEVLGLLEKGDLDPGSFLFRGPAAFHLWGAIDALVVGAQAPFHAGGWSGVVADLRVNPSLLHLVHRLVSALVGVLTVALVFRLARREFGVAAGLLSALVLSVAYLHVRDSHFATVDVLAGFVSLAAIDRMLLLLRDPSRGRYLASGLLAGAAAATKYFGGILGVHLVLAHFLARSSARESGRAEPRHARLALGVLACPLGFLLASPGVVVWAGSLVHHVLFDMEKLKPQGGSLAEILGFHLHYTLACGLGEPAFLLALAGFAGLWRRGRAGRFLVPGSLLLASALVTTRVHNVRFGIPFLVTLAIPAGLALAWAWARLPRALAALAVGAVLAPSLARSWAFDRVLGRPDTRIEMLALLRQRAQPGQDVLAVGLLLDLPVPERESTPRPYHLYALHAAVDPQSDPRLQPPPTILLSLTTPRKDIPDWPAIEELLSSRYREVKRLEVGEDPVWMFEPDGGTPALRIAYAAPWSQTRPGPALVLYERK